MNPNEIVRDMPEVEKWNEEPILPKMMGEDYGKYFIEDEGGPIEFGPISEDEPEHDPDEDKTLERDNNYLTDAKLGN